MLKPILPAALLNKTKSTSMHEIHVLRIQYYDSVKTQKNPDVPGFNSICLSFSDFH